MNINVLIGVVVAVMLIALVSTLLVGFSRGNREENPDYMKKTGRNLTKLTLFYVAVVAVALLVFILIWKR